MENRCIKSVLFFKRSLKLLNLGNLCGLELSSEGKYSMFKDCIHSIKCGIQN